MLGRRSSDATPVSLPVSTKNDPNQSAVSDSSDSVDPTPANDVQVAQLPQQRTPSTSPTPQGRGKLPPSDQRLQVRATTQLLRLMTWDDVIRKPLPEKLEPWMQKPLPDDWEGTLTKINPDYLKWTNAAADKYGIPPLILARLLYKESNYDRNAKSPRGARGVAQLMPDAVKALGLDSNTFDYFDAQKSIDAGAALLAMYHREFKDWRKAVAAYNMGNTALSNWFEGDTNATSPGDKQTQYMLQNVFRGDPQAFEKKP
jgi:soluble lytic murein transglycosylase-like protein